MCLSLLLSIKWSTTSNTNETDISVDRGMSTSSHEIISRAATNNTHLLLLLLVFSALVRWRLILGTAVAEVHDVVVLIDAAVEIVVVKYPAELAK